MNRLIVFFGALALVVLACMPLAAQAENPVGLGSPWAPPSLKARRPTSPIPAEA